VPLTGTPAFGLGAFGIAPWGSWSGASFVDPTAQYIWSEAGAASTAAVNVPVTFSHQLSNPNGVAVDATMHVIVDDTADIAVNGTKVGSA